MALIAWINIMGAAGLTTFAGMPAPRCDDRVAYDTPRAVNGIAVLEHEAVRWHAGLPADLPISIVEAPSFRADSYAYAASALNASPDLILSTLLQGSSRNSYRQLQRLYVLCGPREQRRICLEAGLSGTPYFVDRSGMQPRPINAGRVAAAPFAGRVAVSIRREEGTLFVGITELGAIKKKQNKDIYTFSLEKYSVKLQCQWRNGAYR
ncbi:hypothetical protein [Sphingomonas sp. Leaf20]|uniref:hypothetical protein n=1 Tax=Sphingomonas sp. Leaf20 TaxID=1735685 RepID=UPI000A8CC420|nr:hypothetical protein [Sphingomonas sp. Leaf20]